MLVLGTEILFKAVQAGPSRTVGREQNGFSCAGPGPNLDRSPDKWNSLGERSGSLRDHRHPRTVHVNEHTQALGTQKDKGDVSTTVLLVLSQPELETVMKPSDPTSLWPAWTPGADRASSQVRT